ncbi:ABC transporter permease subunit [Methylobacterium sp. NEAU 140]|uniref:ABC transporter permease n=1 Tax=Methylobacterium sp. NEAU 140 TaxID=3064945 RepID=UPI0027356F12|nr:ABC transporter permease subunit [Methylobacterium sp. NEAU 140]MDP4023965.1 ABC transporter permease subunit [Methylobacterium sp. NEAU 140]
MLTGPVETLTYLGGLLADHEFQLGVWETARAFGLALAIAWGSGLVIGLLLGAHRLTGEVAEPILTALYSVPKITLYPVILLFFGLGLSARVAFGAIHGVVPVALFTMAAVRGVPPVYFRTARSLRLGPVATARHILLPACLPGIVSGLRIGFSLTLLGVLIGEMFASQRGLGHMVIRAMETNDVRLLIALALFLVAVATGAGALLLALDRHVGRRGAGPR